MAEGKQQTPEQPDTGKTKSRKWYVRKRDGSVYGPETTEVLLEWAAQCRLVNGNEVSEDRKVWVAAERIPDLQMCWVAALPDGRSYGPFNVLATHELHKHNVLPADAKLTNTITGETSTVSERVNEQLAHKQGDMFGASEPDAPKPKRKRKRPKTSRTAGREDAVAADESKETQALQTELETLRAQCKSLEEQNRKHKNALKTQKKEHSAALAAVEEERNALAAELEQLREGGEVATPDGSAEQVTALEEQVKTREEELEQTRAELKSRQEDLAALEAKLSDTQQELEIALEATEKKLADETARAAALEEELEAARQAPEGAAEGDGGEAGSEDKATIEALGRQIRVLKEDLEKTRLDLEGAREALEIRDEEVRKLRTEARDGDGTPPDERVEELEARLSAAELDAANREKAFKRERAELKAQFGEAEQRLQEHREQTLELAEKLKKSQAGASGAEARQRALRVDLESRFSKTQRELAGTKTKLARAQKTVSVSVITALACLVLSITFLSLWAGGCDRSDKPELPPDEPPAVSETDGEEGEGAEPGGVDAGETDDGEATADVTPPSAGENRPVYPRINVPGVETRFTSTTCTMTFEQPVFTSMTTISSASKTLLKQLATQVRGYMGDFTLTVRGHTDNVPLRGKGLYRDNKELGLARAKAVQTFLAEEGKLPARGLKAVTAGSDNPPFPNDKAESRRKNRTVVLILVKNK